jgi:hypothetical protein
VLQDAAEVEARSDELLTWPPLTSPPRRLALVGGCPPTRESMVCGGTAPRGSAPCPKCVCDTMGTSHVRGLRRRNLNDAASCHRCYGRNWLPTSCMSLGGVIGMLDLAVMPLAAVEGGQNRQR